MAETEWNYALNAEGQAAGTWRIAVVEDHLLQRRRTVELINSQRGLQVVQSTESLEELVSWLQTQTQATAPHLVVLDLVVDRGVDADPAVVERVIAAGIHVLVISAMASPPQVREMLRAGVAGIVGKRDDENDIISALWSVLGKRQWMTSELAAVIAGDERRPKLSAQEERALVLYASGLTLSEVAEAIGVGVETAKTYLNRVKQKYAELGRPVRTKVDLARVAAMDGLVSLDEEADRVP